MINSVQQADLIVGIVFLVASTGVIALRTWDRKHTRRLPLAVDDYTILVSLGFVWAWTITTIIWVTRYGLGSASALDPRIARPWGKIYYADRLFYCCGFNLAKVAIILFYIKLTDHTTQARYWRFLQAVLAFTVFDFVLHFFILAIPCVPVSTFWSVGFAPDRGPNCLDSPTSAIVINTFTFLSEALIVLAPIPLLWLSGLSGKQRIALGCMFSLGILIIIASALKLRSVINAASQQPAYQTGIAYIWVAIEMNVAILVAGFLPLKALLEASFRRLSITRFSPAQATSISDCADSTRRKSTPDVEAALAVDHMIYQPDASYSTPAKDTIDEKRDKEKQGDV